MVWDPDESEEGKVHFHLEISVKVTGYINMLVYAMSFKERR